MQPVDMELQTDAEGHALRDHIASTENWRSIRKLLPLEMRPFIRFTGHVWQLVNHPPPALFIANRPVLQASEGYSPATTKPLLREKPKDPYHNLSINPVKALEANTAQLIFEFFLECEAFFIFFDGSMLVIYGDDVNLVDRWAEVPYTFAGLTVGIQHNAMTPTSGERQAPKSEAETDVLEIGPGAKLEVRGPLYPTLPKNLPDKYLNDAIPMFDVAEASAGLLLRRNGETRLSTVTHLRSKWYAAQRVSAVKIKNYLPKDFELQQPDELQVYLPGRENPIGHFATTFDPDAEEFPRGFVCDLSLIILHQPTHMSLAAELEFASDPNDIFYNKRIEVLSDRSPVAKGRCLPGDYGTSIGQGFVRRNIGRRLKPASRQLAEDHADDMLDQFARSYLWRTNGNWKSLQGVSGSPLQVSDSQGQPRILGFANFQWDPRMLATMWGEEGDDVEQLSIDETDAMMLSNAFGFYGTYFLPSAVKEMQIVEQA